MDLPSLSIIIITYNEEKNIGNLLKSLHKQSFQDFQIIISDSNSIDNTQKEAEKYKNYFKEFKFHNFKKTLGPAYGRNEGVKFAKYEQILFLDADVILDDTKFLENCLRKIVTENIGVAGTYVKTSSRLLKIRLLYKIINLAFVTTYYVGQNINIGALIFSKLSIHKEFNGFDSSIKTIGEDADYIRRISKKYKFKNLPFKYTFSSRRFENQGVCNILFIWIKATIYLFLKLDSNKISYNFGIYSEEILQYKVIIFDFDGVIGDSFDFVVECIYDNMKKFTRVKLSKEDIAQELRTISLFEIIKKYKIPKPLILIIVFKLKRDLSKRLEFSKVFPNSQKVLKSLQNQKFTIGLLTSNSKKNINYFLHTFNLKDKFDFVYTSSSLFKKDKTINKILKKYSLNSSEILYVGDEVRDILACQRVGVDIAVVTYGYNSKELLEKYEPTFIIDSLEEIKKLVR